MGGSQAVEAAPDSLINNGPSPRNADMPPGGYESGNSSTVHTPLPEIRKREKSGASESVMVRVYDLGTSTWVSGFGYTKNYGAYHTGVEVYGIEWGFGMSEDTISGISWCKPGMHPDHTFRETLSMGYTLFSRDDVFALVEDMKKEWTGRSYHILERNCHHFSDAFCKRLNVAGLPNWINNLAGAGAMTAGAVGTVYSGVTETASFAFSLPGSVACVATSCLCPVSTRKQIGDYADVTPKNLTDPSPKALDALNEASKTKKKARFGADGGSQDQSPRPLGTSRAAAASNATAPPHTTPIPSSTPIASAAELKPDLNFATQSSPETGAADIVPEEPYVSPRVPEEHATLSPGGRKNKSASEQGVESKGSEIRPARKAKLDETAYTQPKDGRNSIHTAESKADDHPAGRPSLRRPETTYWNESDKPHDDVLRD